VDALLLSFGVVFVAELGDKSQLMVLAFATRYRVLPVIIGISAASAVMLGASVLVGAVVGDALPTDAATVLAGLAFLGFAAWTLRGDGHGAGDAPPVERRTGSAVLTVAVAFVLAELGDKTMLATVTLATTRGLWGTWAGATLGMVAANALAVAGGRALGARLSDRALQLGAAGLFVVFGVVLLVDGLTG
jgi:putative Ca2+/H+ antiporter (TMEM165/GDT1 family)